jgi:transcriptional regulator with XRE-family HTH domain
LSGDKELIIRSTLASSRHRYYFDRMITAAQSKMARAGLGWSIAKLAAAAQVGMATVARFETGASETIPTILAAIQRALEAAGIEFLPDNGVRLKATPKPPSGGSTPGSARKPATPGKTAAPRAKKPTASDRQAMPSQSKEAQIRALREQGADET